MTNIIIDTRTSASDTNHRGVMCKIDASKVVLALASIAFTAACATDDVEAPSADGHAALAQQAGFAGDQVLGRFPGTYAIVAENSAKCLDLYRDSSANDTQAVQYRCGTGNVGVIQPSQTWRVHRENNGYVTIQSMLSTSAKCLDVSHQSQSNNASVVLFDCRDQPSQHWQIEPQEGAKLNLSGVAVEWTGLISFRNALTNKCLTVDHVSSSDNASIVQYDCNGGTNQNWKMGLRVLQ